MLKIIYNGKDISEQVSVNSCVVEQNLSPKTHNATLIFNDTDKTGWAAWGVSLGDVIELSFDDYSLGEFIIESILENRGTFGFELTSSGVQRETTASYVLSGSLKNALQKVCRDLKAEAVFFGDFEADIEFLAFEHVRGFEILERLGLLFGFCFLENKGKIRFLTFDYLKEQKPETWKIIDEDEYAFEHGRKLGKLILTNGAKTGEAEESEGTGAKTEILWGVLDLSKAAQNMLWGLNLMKTNALKMTSKHVGEPFSFPGKTLKIENAGVVFDGVWLVVCVRFDCGSRSCTLGLRRLK